MLETIGFEPAMARWVVHADARVGRVVRVDRGLASVLTESGPVRATFGSHLLAHMAMDSTSAPCTGDFVVLRDWPDHRTTLDLVLPRRTAVIRATAGEQSVGQVLCANLDIAAVVVSLHPAPAIGKVERMVALAWQSGAQPVVVLTKADTVPDAEFVAAGIAVAAPGVEVICTSTVTGAGLSRLHELISGRHTIALLGSSGHGKSSLTNALVGAEVLTTRVIRADGRGRHTSVRRELVVLPHGGAVIDTPGLRGVGLVDAEGGLGRTFADIDDMADQCRFADCAHHVEPDCAIRAALADGSLPLRRFESWQRLQRGLEWMASRKDARLRAQRSRRWRTATPESWRGRG